MSVTDLSPEMVTAPERKVVGTAKSYNLSNRSDIPAQWQAFFEAGYSFENAVEGAMFGVSMGSNDDGDFRYGVGMEISGDPGTLAEGLCQMVLSQGTYAVLKRFGPVSNLVSDMDRMFEEWLPSSDYSLRSGAMFERYPHDERNGPDGMVYEIWMPVRAA